MQKEVFQGSCGRQSVSGKAGIERRGDLPPVQSDGPFPFQKKNAYYIFAQCYDIF